MKFFKTTYQDEDESIGDYQYHLDFLRVFELESYDDDSINSQVDGFYKNVVLKNKELMKLVEGEKIKYGVESLEIATMLMFSWDNLHRLCDFMST